MITHDKTIIDALNNSGKNIIFQPVSVFNSTGTQTEQELFKQYKRFCMRDNKFYYNYTFMKIPLRLYSQDRNNPTGAVYKEILDLHIRLVGNFDTAQEQIAVEQKHIEYQNTTPPQHHFTPIT